MTDKTLTVIEKEIPLLQEKILSLTITDTESLNEASTYLIKAKKYLKSSKEDMDKLIDPIKESIDLIKAKYEPKHSTLKSIIDDLTTKTTQYQTTLINAQRKEEQAITDRIGDGKGKLKLETAVKKLESLPTISKSVTTDTGSMSFIEHPMCELKDIAQLPLSYHLADMVAVRAQMKLGNKLPGVRYWTEQRPRNTK